MLNSYLYVVFSRDAIALRLSRSIIEVCKTNLALTAKLDFSFVILLLPRHRSQFRG